LKAPRLEIKLNQLHHNAKKLIENLALQGISITGVSKATMAMPEIVNIWINAGIHSIGESRIENIESINKVNNRVRTLLTRIPMLSQVDQVVSQASISCNSELSVLNALAGAAEKQNLRHGVLLMVELGDLREGILPKDLNEVVKQVMNLPNLELIGIGANLGCQNGVAPDQKNMNELSLIMNNVEADFKIKLEWCSGGNSANLPWLTAGGEPDRLNHLRLGEALLLGREPLTRTIIKGLYTDAITLVVEVIETKLKPTTPWGIQYQTSFSDAPSKQNQKSNDDRNEIFDSRILLAIGEQDIDPSGLKADGIEIKGASSDYLVVSSSQNTLKVGCEQRFSLNYSALLRAMTSPYIKKYFVN
jgi:predicted amino acid racemase